MQKEHKHYYFVHKVLASVLSKMQTKNVTARDSSKFSVRMDCVFAEIQRMCVMFCCVALFICVTAISSVDSMENSEWRFL